MYQHFEATCSLHLPIITILSELGRILKICYLRRHFLIIIAAKYWHHDLLSVGIIPGSRTKRSEQCLWHVQYKTEGQLSGTNAVIQWDHYKAMYEQPQQDSCKIHPKLSNNHFKAFHFNHLCSNKEEYTNRWDPVTNIMMLGRVM